ncbi:hypothetical protein BpHYR1_023892 [Brachionus plicatilis]|uniref:Uncharacterized protein n=1 Tax=Brachionus plicatilis TaxID=10195 RepID=A0A3M7RL63_BRAPC|nr:hypothetical protein BpHYR1_023892 [Brachionus plicatilis]
MGDQKKNWHSSIFGDSNIIDSQESGHFVSFTLSKEKYFTPNFMPPPILFYQRFDQKDLIDNDAEKF